MSTSESFLNNNKDLIWLTIAKEDLPCSSQAKTIDDGNTWISSALIQLLVLVEYHVRCCVS